MKKYKVAIENLGCAKNNIDSELMLGFLEKYGFNIVENYENADVIIVNTCGFITEAKEESINAILNYANIKNSYGKPFLIAAGCLSQRYANELLSDINEIDGVIGPGKIEDIADIVWRVLCNERVMEIGEKNSICEDHTVRVRMDKSPTAYIKVAEGCDNYCAYCAIPYIRGGYRSRPVESIVHEANELSKSGVKEIILVAQETTRYGLDLYGEYKLAQLLKELVEIKNIEWIRLLYCYPTSITGELIDVIAQEDKVCKYIDLPLQHINNDILKKMNRRGSKEEIKKLIKKLRGNIPDLTLRTTFIIGFPGETEEKFKELLGFIEEVKFERAGVFAYSQEEGTPAASMPGQIPEEIKQQRVQEAMFLQQQLSYEKNKAKIGKEYKVLVEGFDYNNKMYVGRTQGDAPEVDGQVFFYSPYPVLTGSTVQVLINEVDEYDITGELIHEFAQ